MRSWSASLHPMAPGAVEVPPDGEVEILFSSDVQLDLIQASYPPSFLMFARVELPSFFLLVWSHAIPLVFTSARASPCFYDLTLSTKRARMAIAPL